MSIPRGKIRKNTKSRLPPFVPIFVSELNSKAYQELTGNAVKALTYFKRFDGIIKAKTGKNCNGIFDFTYSEAEKIGFARRTFARVISELIEKGFLDMIVQGGKRGCGFSNSKFKMSERWQNFGTQLFKKHPRHPSEP